MQPIYHWVRVMTFLSFGDSGEAMKEATLL